MLKKFFRNRAKFLYKNNFKQELLCDVAFDNPIMQAFFQQINLCLQDAVSFFKNSPGDTSTVGIVKNDQNQFVIKRYNIKNFWHGLKLQFRKSHAFRSFYYAYFLPEFGIPAIKPVAVIQKKYGIFKGQSYFVSQYMPGMPGCHYFRDEAYQQLAWQETIDLILNVTAKMRENSIYHGDFHFGNFVIVDKEPILLDFDRIKIIKNKKRFKKLHEKDLKNFTRYLKRNPLAWQAFKNHSKNVFHSSGNACLLTEEKPSF